MFSLRSTIQFAALHLLLLITPTTLADTLNRTMCYCGTDSRDLDARPETGCYYFFQYHSNPYNLDFFVDYTCRALAWENICTVKARQTEKRCRTFHEGWEFCYDLQGGNHPDKYSVQGVKNLVGGIIQGPPQEEVDRVCAAFCVDHVGLPLVAPWQKPGEHGKGQEYGVSKIEIFSELADIVLPSRGFPPYLKPSEDDE